MFAIFRNNPQKKVLPTGASTTGASTTGASTTGFPTRTTGFPTRTTGFPTRTTGFPTRTTGASTTENVINLYRFRGNMFDQMKGTSCNSCGK